MIEARPMRDAALFSIIVVAVAVACQRPDPDPVILALGEQSVRRGEFLRYVAGLEARATAPFEHGVRREVLDAFLEERVLVLEARRRGLLPAISAPEQEQRAVQELMASEVARRGGVEESDVERAYAEHPEMCDEPERVTVRQVLVPTENEAREVRRQAERDAKNFDLLARSRSRSPEAPRGGMMGTFARGELPPELEAAAFALDEGRISEVVKSPFGYHVLRVDERRPARRRALEDCRADLRQRLAGERAETTMRTFVRELLARAQVNHEAAMANPSPS